LVSAVADAVTGRPDALRCLSPWCLVVEERNGEFGLLRAVFARKRSRQAALTLAGMIVAVAVVIGLEGLAWTAPAWIFVLVVGPLFGLAFASGFPDSNR
jgi:hypothetical protein